MPSKLSSKKKSSRRKIQSDPLKKTKKSSRRKSSRRKVQSDPNKKRTSSSFKKRKEQAEKITPRFKTYGQIEMENIKRLRDKYGTIPYSTDGSVLFTAKEADTKIKEQLDETYRQKDTLQQIERINEKQMEQVTLNDLPFMKGREDERIQKYEDPDAVMGELNCKELSKYCMTNRSTHNNCYNVKENYERYILPCKTEAEVNRMINNLVNKQFTSDMLLDYENLLNMDIETYLVKYLSYGRVKENNHMEVYIKTNFEDNIVLNQLYSYDLVEQDELIEMEDRWWNNLWIADEFLKTITTQQEDENDTPGILSPFDIIDLLEEKLNTLDKNSNSYLILNNINENRKKYRRNSLSWWAAILGLDIYVMPRIDELITHPICAFLLSLEDSILEAFNGDAWFGHVSDETHGWFKPLQENLQIQTVGNVIAWLKVGHSENEDDKIGKRIKSPSEHSSIIKNQLLQFKERFVRFGKFRYKDYHIIDKFKEFIELLDIGNSNVIDVINEELNILVDQVQSKDELSEEEQRIQEIEED